MKRDDPDAFSPLAEKPALQPRTSSTTGALFPPGPSPAWSAKGVIAALEPLLLPGRRQRLQDVLDQRVGSVVAVMDNPHDPHNGSAVIRSCDAFGVQKLHVLVEREEFLTSRNVAKGAQRWVDIQEHHSARSLIDTLRAGGFRIVTTHPQGRLSLADLGGMERIALVFGNEHEGVGPELTQAADDTLRIRMTGFVESLNVSVSAALCLHAATEGRNGDLTGAERANVYARWLRASVPRADDVLAALDAS